MANKFEQIAKLAVEGGRQHSDPIGAIVLQALACCVLADSRMKGENRTIGQCVDKAILILRGIVAGDKPCLMTRAVFRQVGIHPSAESISIVMGL